MNLEHQVYFTSILREQFGAYPAGIYLFKSDNRNTRKMREICSKLTVKTPEQLGSGAIIVNFENIPHVFLIHRLVF